MKKDDLQTVVNRIRESNSYEEAYFKAAVYGGATDESYIYANRQGLELFAAQLLQASVAAAETDTKPDSMPFLAGIEEDDEWLDGDIYFDHIRLFSGARKDQVNEPPSEEKEGRFGGVVIIGIIVGLILSLLVGIYTIGKFIVSLFY